MPGLGDADALHASLEEIRRTLDGVESGLAGIRSGRRPSGRVPGPQRTRSRGGSAPAGPRESLANPPREWPAAASRESLAAEAPDGPATAPRGLPATAPADLFAAEPPDPFATAPADLFAAEPPDPFATAPSPPPPTARRQPAVPEPDEPAPEWPSARSGTDPDLRGAAITHATAGRHRQIRRPWVVALVAGLLLVALVVTTVNLLGRREPAAGSAPGAGTQAPVGGVAGAAGSDGSSAGGGGSAAGAAAGAGTASTEVAASTAVDAPPLLWPGGSTDAPPQLPTTGPGVDAPGTDVVVAPGANGQVEVYERVNVAAPDAAGLQLALPDLSKATTLTVGANLVVTELRITADGRPVEADPFAGHWVIHGQDGRAVTRAVLRYRLSGALVQHEQSLPGRALILVAPLSAGVSRAGGAPVVVRADRVVVRDMTCPLAGPAQVLCGSGGRPTWVATVPASSTVPLVLLQVDLVG